MPAELALCIDLALQVLYILGQTTVYIGGLKNHNVEVSKQFFRTLYRPCQHVQYQHIH
jgi:hypothetical protein